MDTNRYKSTFGFVDLLFISKSTFDALPRTVSSKMSFNTTNIALLGDAINLKFDPKIHPHLF